MAEVKQVAIEELINIDNIIIEEKYVTGYYSESLQVVGIVWNGVFTKDQYIDFFNRLLEFGRTHKAIGLYSDLRKQGVVSIDARKHFEKHIAPEAAKLGIDKTGAVSDASPFKKYYLNTIIKMTGRPAKICDNPIDALNYILS